MNRTQPIDYKSVLSLFLPAGLLDYFDITEASNMGDYFLLVLVEKDIVPENLAHIILLKTQQYYMSPNYLTIATLFRCFFVALLS